MKSFNHSIIYRFSINLFFVLFLGLFNLSYSQNQIEPEAQKSVLLPERTMFSENIIYKTDQQGKSILLDLYKPKKASSEKLPVVIYVHGGGWVQGDKIIRADSYIENTILKLIEKNYAVISIDYTLVSETVHFPSPIEDTKDAVKWVRKNADKYNFDQNNIGLFGASAGAHLSMLAAYTNDNEFVGNPELSPYSAKVNYVISNFGPTDLNKLLHTRAGKIPVFFIGLFAKNIVDLREKIVTGMSGYDIKKDKRKVIEYFKTISPLTYVDNGIPTLIVQGDKDKVVPMKQSKKLHRKLKKENIQNSLTIVEDGLHGFRSTDKEHLDRITDEMVNFVVSQKK
ncbi:MULTISPECIES: alpha/beta hydrolase [Chryseobacterium]|uniref:Acetyl esterase/lipase n=1 Tax=Chryseobacterium geocarposphaerae TaxID=1416776 RepID=A0ABU1LGX2_9FLAO|nr:MULTISPECIES: alpha/beta hydrolase [Chryseobacterium]MDR6405976.1 acetyl esterase/lipase [Chryseobacterium geocarposphaerae]MDR6699579.1 acetyl esterase/lipase [Chryseobacterium ginsenosidimutans]